MNLCGHDPGLRCSVCRPVGHTCCPCVARLSAELRAELKALEESLSRPALHDVRETAGRVEWRGVRPELRIEGGRLISSLGASGYETVRTEE